jgi:hypothetical protein
MQQIPWIGSLILQLDVANNEAPKPRTMRASCKKKAAPNAMAWIPDSIINEADGLKRLIGKNICHRKQEASIQTLSSTRATN